MQLLIVVYYYYNYSESALRRVCKSFDKNGDGTIDKAEMKAVFEELNRDLSDSVCILPLMS